MTNNILNLNYPVISAVFDNFYNIYIATSYEIYVYKTISNLPNSFLGFDDYNGKINQVFNNIQAMTLINNVIYVSDLEILSDSVPNLKIYSIDVFTLTATLYYNNINPVNFNNISNNIGNSYKIKLDTFSVVQNTIIFINTQYLWDIAYFGSIIKNVEIKPSILTCNESIQRGLSNITYNNEKYFVYGNIIFYNNTYYLFGLVTTYIVNTFYSDENDVYYDQYTTNKEYKFMYVNQPTLESVNPDNITFVDTSCNIFIYSTITTTGDIYIYETDNINYYINVYNTFGFIKNVYTKNIDIITGLISDTKGNAYAIQRNDPYSNIILISNNIGDIYKIDTYNGDNSCLNLYSGSYMFRSFVFFNPVNVKFSFDAYLYPNCSAYFNFFTNCDGSGGACLCLSTDVNCGITNSNRLILGNTPTSSTFTILPNTWHKYEITIDQTYNINWFIDGSSSYVKNENTFQLNTYNLPSFSGNNNFCGFIANTNNLLIDNISIVENNTP